MDNPAEPPLDYEPPPMPTETELHEMLDRSDADIEAGRTYPVDTVLAEMEQRIALMEARQAARRT